MPEKWESSGARLTEKPCSVTQRRTLHAERADLGLAAAPVGPDADPPRRPPRRDAELAERRDQPAFERMDEVADVAPAPVEVEQDVADPLARPVIGVAPAAPGLVDRKALRD